MSVQENSASTDPSNSQTINIDIIYIVTNKAYQQRGRFHIVGQNETGPGREPFLCNASLSWKNIKERFLCKCHPRSRQFTDFSHLDNNDMVVPRDKRIEIRLAKMVERDGETLLESWAGKDDNGNDYMKIRIPKMGEGGVDEVLGGKMMKEGEGEADVVLTAEERKRMKADK
ncbi:hypothetical protein MMC28_000297 [Mycoblastus sanguinarius]|nr:hypothetical protein [Mycoblastus sanguinarius]